MQLDSDDFDIYGLPRIFALDRAELDARRRSLQAEVHPDRFAAADPASRRMAMQRAVRVNEAYERLKDPLRRAACLCEMNGAPVRAEDNTAMPADFLMQQMQWREALDDADGIEDIDQIASQAASRKREQLSKIEHLLDADKDFPAAARQVRGLMFIERFGAEVDARIDALGQ